MIDVVSTFSKNLFERATGEVLFTNILSIIAF